MVAWMPARSFAGMVPVDQVEIGGCQPKFPFKSSEGLVDQEFQKLGTIAAGGFWSGGQLGRGESDMP
jgi:hypothetical protein